MAGSGEETDACSTSTIAAITELVFLETLVETADIILIPGGHPRQLMERAAELYHRGLAPWLLPSGGPNATIPGGLTEWEHLRSIGVELGVPESAFLLEDRARHTFESAESSWGAIVTAGIGVSRAIIVCKAFHARRAFMTYATVFPEHVTLTVSPIHDERDIRRVNWHTTPQGIAKVMSELEKIGRYFGPHIPALDARRAP